MKPLTDEQIENWRNLLTIQFGPYALIMSREEIEQIKQKMEESYNTEEK